eukprot:14803321-Alexandrium_andersonii.AAC.1
MADIRALGLQRARCRRRAARGDRLASVRLDGASGGALLRRRAPEAPHPPAGAGVAAGLVQLGSPLGRSAGDAGSLSELEADADTSSTHCSGGAVRRKRSSSDGPGEVPPRRRPRP